MIVGDYSRLPASVAYAFRLNVVSTADGRPAVYTCMRTAERSSWIASLRRSLQPGLANIFCFCFHNAIIRPRNRDTRRPAANRRVQLLSDPVAAKHKWLNLSTQAYVQATAKQLLVSARRCSASLQTSRACGVYLRDESHRSGGATNVVPASRSLCNVCTLAIVPPDRVRCLENLDDTCR